MTDLERVTQERDQLKRERDEALRKLAVEHEAFNSEMFERQAAQSECDAATARAEKAEAERDEALRGLAIEHEAFNSEMFERQAAQAECDAATLRAEAAEAALARAREVAAHAACMLRAVLTKNSDMPGFAVLEDLDRLAATDPKDEP
jgi:septal ring factor EnvC (AmiA/AmiB activator)